MATLSTPTHHTLTRRAPHGSSNSNLNPNLPLTLTLTLPLILTRRAAWLFCACSDALPRWLDSQASTACTLHTHTARAHCTHTPSALAPPAPTAQALPFTLRPPPVLQASTPTKAALGLLLCLLLLLHLLSCALCCGGAPKRGRKTREKKLDGQRQQESSK